MGLINPKISLFSRKKLNILVLSEEISSNFSFLNYSYWAVLFCIGRWVWLYKYNYYWMEPVVKKKSLEELYDVRALRENDVSKVSFDFDWDINEKDAENVEKEVKKYEEEEKRRKEEEQKKKEQKNKK